MKIVFSHHAQCRLLERGIDGFKAKSVVKSPDSKRFTDDGRIIALKEVDGTVIKAVYVEEGNLITIISVMFVNEV